MEYGLICFAIGLVILTLGGLIVTARNPRALNDLGRAMFDPVRKDIPHDAQNSFNRLLLNDPKAKWLTRVGLALCIIGLGISFFTVNEARDPTSSQPAKTTIEIKK